MSDQRTPFWIRGVDRRADVKAVVLEELEGILAEALPHAGDRKWDMETLWLIVRQRLRHMARDIPEVSTDSTHESVQWSPSPPFTEPVVQSRCGAPDTIPAAPVRELVKGVEIWGKEALERGWFTQDSIRRWFELTVLARNALQDILPPRKPCTEELDRA